MEKIKLGDRVTSTCHIGFFGIVYSPYLRKDSSDPIWEIRDFSLESCGYILVDAGIECRYWHAPSSELKIIEERVAKPIEEPHIMGIHKEEIDWKSFEDFMRNL